MTNHEWTSADLWADERYDDRAWLRVDLADWPADHAPQFLPPVPVIAVGAAHPQADAFDIHVADDAACLALARAIEAIPATAGVIARLLRSIEGIAPEPALTLESLAFAALQGGAEHRRWLAARVPSPIMPPGRVHLLPDDGALDIVIDRRDARNAIDRAMRDALFDAFKLATLDDGIATVRLRSVGRCFSVGADLAEFGTTTDPVRADAIRARTLPAGPLLRRRGVFEVRIQGACIGSGLELAAFADRAVATPDAWFQLPEARMGVLPGFGGCVSIPRRIGRQRALWLMLSGRRIDARTALAWGLIDAIMDEPATDQRRADDTGG